MTVRRETPGIHPYHGSAGGWDALKATAVALRRQEALVDDGVALLKSNQPDGFDCPGCAGLTPTQASP